MKIFLSTHGKMASGMRSSVEILAGDSSCLTTFDAYIDQDTVEQHVEKFFEDNPDEFKVLCSDIFGGSVNQVLTQYANRENTVVLTGINLCLLISLVLAAEREDITREDIEQMLKESLELTKIITLDFEVKDEEFF